MIKLGLICLVVLAALAITGVDYGAWSQTLNINAPVATGSYNVLFQQAVTNDDGAAGNILDPSSQGSWSWTSGSLNAAEWVTGTRSANNKAVATISGTGTDTLTLNINRAYVGYWSSVGCTIKNLGSIPIKINTVTATITPPTGRTASDISVYYSNALVQASHTQINPGNEVLGAIYIQWNAVPNTSSNYGLTLTVNTTQAVLSLLLKEDDEIDRNLE